MSFRKERHFLIITFFGHSDYSEKEEDKKIFLSQLEKIVKDEFALFYLGGYGAFDGCAKKWCLEYKKTHPKVKLILVIPYLNRNYSTKNYDETLYPLLETVPKRLAIVRRNAFMIDSADYIICYVSHLGNARNMLDIAMRKGKPICNIPIILNNKKTP